MCLSHALCFATYFINQLYVLTLSLLPQQLVKLYYVMFMYISPLEHKLINDPTYGDEISRPRRDWRYLRKVYVKSWTSKGLRK